ncbi:54S ribosomal protein L31, mitochondrial [Lachnellula willkommii]|uniref:54S ribosomal protein L31, mitochondrial n=1 Tax=Lachnellula willkommii TaxID=215461 RepID=A0A559M584_9HELO|nr:54S ribosomal protein L31, mitochondrial [Lachnellula willkommii]
MFGAFKPTNPLSGGLLWKIPWRLSKFQKARQRKRLRAVDSLVATLDKALTKKSITTRAVERWKEEMPIEQEMVPKDKYTIFDRKEKKYRKSIRSGFSMANAGAVGHLLTQLQSYQSGQEYHSESILRDTEWNLWTDESKIVQYACEAQGWRLTRMYIRNEGNGIIYHTVQPMFHLKLKYGCEIHNA